MQQYIDNRQFAELRSDLQETLAPRVERLGYFGEFFGVFGRHPDALLANIKSTEALKSVIGTCASEVIALTVTAVLGATYEQRQHEQLSVRLGFTPEWVGAVLRLQPDADFEWTAFEPTFQRFALAAIPPTTHTSTQAHLLALIDEVGPEVATAATLLTGRYVADSIAVVVFDLAPPVASVLETPR